MIAMREDSAATTGLEPIAVIDIGSNSVRLVVYEGAVRSPTPLFNEKALCGLGREVASSGRLGEAGITSALSALRRFHAICRNLGVKNVQAIATAAVREAANGAAFITAAESALGTRIQVLTGEREATLAAHGIMMGFHEPEGIAGDLGGGSLEVIDIAGRRMANAMTLPLGGLRLIDVTGNRLDAAVGLVDAEIARVPWLAQGRGRSFYAVGGTWRSLARMHMDRSGYPLRVMHGYAVPTAEMIAFCEHIRSARKLTSLKGIAVVSRARRDVLPFGALCMERLLIALAPREVVFSVFGIREGLLFSFMTPDQQRQDPLLSFALDYARLRSRSVQHAIELTRWTDALFVPGGLDETPAERRLRHAACLLSDIGWRAHPDYRGEQSLNVIANAALAGVDHAERMFLALSIFFRHAGPSANTDDLPDGFRTMVSKRASRRARLIAAAVRAAHMLAVGMPGVLDDIPVRLDGQQLVLTIPQAYADLDGERLRRRFAALGEIAELQSVVAVG